MAVIVDNKAGEKYSPQPFQRAIRSPQDQFLLSSESYEGSDGLIVYYTFDGVLNGEVPRSITFLIIFQFICNSAAGNPPRLQVSLHRDFSDSRFAIHNNLGPLLIFDKTLLDQFL